jgi:hypothetical protein
MFEKFNYILKKSFEEFINKILENFKIVNEKIEICI